VLSFLGLGLVWVRHIGGWQTPQQQT
jgi:hypothetical protein